MRIERCHLAAWAATVVACAAGVVFARVSATTPPPSPAAAGATTVATDPAARGRAVYDAHCVECHGKSGAGDGPAALLLDPRPRDFTSGKFKIRSTDTGSVPTDDDLIRSVSDGLHGTSMPAWRGVLADGDIRAVVGYIKTMSPRFAADPPKPVPAADIAVSPDRVARGQRAFEKLQCSGCHGTDGRGKDAIATEFEDDWGAPLEAADLTRPWQFRGGPTARDIYLRLRTGMSGTPMPSFSDAASDADLMDAAAYVTSLARKPIWSMTGNEVAAQYAREQQEAKADPVKRGHYLVEALNCPLCHSPVDSERRVIKGMKLAGGVHMRIEPFGDYYTCNLTSDKETGIGARTDEELRRTLTQGILHDGTRLPPYPMDWAAWASMPPDDLNAIIAYLRTVPPVHNKVPPFQRAALPAYFWGKFQMLILHKDQPLRFYPGNAGDAQGGRS